MSQETYKPPPLSSDEWFSKGRRVFYNPKEKRIVPNKNLLNDDTVAVFERTVVEPIVSLSAPNSQRKRWITLLPGFPDGSYGYHKIESLLSSSSSNSMVASSLPRLYIEYVGQGDSDKPKSSSYNYSTMERADLVEAQWMAHGIQQTVLVAFDYSSLVMMELLQRQRERQQQQQQQQQDEGTRIEHVLAINGGLFADGHSHPRTTTPLLKTPFLGRMGSWMAQRSNLIFDAMLRPLYSSKYDLSQRELRETERAIRRHHGAHFLASAASFVSEHQRKYVERWNLQTINEEYARHKGITLHLVGSELDQFEHKQIDLARDRLLANRDDKSPNVTIEWIPGGHLATSEQADLLAQMIEVMARK